MKENNVENYEHENELYTHISTYVSPLLVSYASSCFHAFSIVSLRRRKSRDRFGFKKVSRSQIEIVDG